MHLTSVIGASKLTFILSLGLAWSASLALGQSGLGSITGAVSDPSGATVANALVEAKNVASGSVDRVRSTSTGNYWVPEVAYGTYEISASAPGFKKYLRQDVSVSVGQIVRIDVQLEIGPATETYVVTAAAPLL